MLKAVKYQCDLTRIFTRWRMVEKISFWNFFDVFQKNS
jgi:hypothetical protein